ncbi:hypothetical protein P9112_012774 [Eukaryota sp. TZLM1-RC]
MSLEERVQHIEYRLGLSFEGSCTVDLSDFRSRLYELRSSIISDDEHRKQLEDSNTKLQKQNKELSDKVSKMEYRIQHLVKTLEQLDPNPVTRPQP